jgi:hypothetical protein
MGGWKQFMVKNNFLKRFGDAIGTHERTKNAASYELVPRGLRGLKGTVKQSCPCKSGAVAVSIARNAGGV